MINTVLSETIIDHDEFSAFEKITLGLFVALISAFIFISAWSYILLTLEMIDGGGPLGYLVRFSSSLLVST